MRAPCCDKIGMELGRKQRDRGQRWSNPPSLARTAPGAGEHQPAARSRQLAGGWSVVSSSAAGHTRFTWTLRSAHMTTPSPTIKWLAILVILGAGLIHVLEARDSFDEATYKGVLFVA